MQSTLENIEELYGERDEYVEGFLLEECEEEHQIWLDGSFIRCEELGVDIYTGEYCVYDEDEQDYYPDFTVYVFVSQDTKDEVLYWEGYSSLSAAVNNYMRQIQSDLNQATLQFELLPEI